jgi:hypothetical protein
MESTVGTGGTVKRFWLRLEELACSLVAFQIFIFIDFALYHLIPLKPILSDYQLLKPKIKFPFFISKKINL